MRTKPHILTSVSEVVDAFGGTTRAAEWAGHGKSAVSNWIDRGFIPPHWHYRMSRWAAERGFEISPAVFGEDDDLKPRKRPRVHSPAL